MGYVPVLRPYLPPSDESGKPTPPRLNLDRFGLPRDYATYVWLLYRRRVTDESPQRLAFEHNSGPWPRRGPTIPSERR